MFQVQVNILIINSSTWTVLTPTYIDNIHTYRTSNEILFTPTLNGSSSSVVISYEQQYGTVWLDNVQLYEANITITKPDDYILFDYNPTNITKTITLNGTYIDSRNQSYSGNINIMPYRSIILIKN